MFWGMQDFDFAQIYSFLPKFRLSFAQILSNLPEFLLQYAKIESNLLKSN